MDVLNHIGVDSIAKSFNWSGYHFDENRSSDTRYVFILS